MKYNFPKKFFSLLLIQVFAVCVLTGCTSLSFLQSSDDTQNLSISGFAFDTTYTLTLYQGGSKKVLDHCVSLCTKYENIFSTTRKNSELYQLNQVEKKYETLWKQVAHTDEKISEITPRQRKKLQKKLDLFLKKKDWEHFQGKITSRGGLRLEISEELSQITDKALFYCRLSQGKFDITIAPVSSLWDFTSGEGKVPQAEEIRQALQYVDYTNVSQTGTTLTLYQPGIQIDLGGIAKGYIADRLKEYLSEQGVTGAIIDLGGNILCMGGKTTTDPFRIGIQQPFADRNETIATIDIRDKSVVSSGVYQRYIQTEDGKIYHHILDPSTGYSFDNGLLGVTIISEKSVDGDGLSTTVFALGLEKGLELVESLDDVEAAFITEDETIIYSTGFPGQS
jgi:thiamine biosynthesis lipoprotein